MENSLERLDYLISVKLDPVNTTGINDASGMLNDCIEDVARECAFIRTSLFKRSVSIQKEKALLLLVQQCQASIIRLLDIVFDYKFNDPASPLNTTYDAIANCLDKLLCYIETRFPKYFNKDERVPAFTLHKTRLLIRKELRSLERSVFLNTDPHLNQIVSGQLLKVTLNNSKAIPSYKNLEYIKDLLSELKNIQPSVHDTNNQLMDLLVYMNFNAADLLNYYVKNIQSEIAQCNTPSLKIDALLAELKKLNQVQVKTGIAYKPQMHALKEQVGVWISEEIAYLEKQLALTCSPAIQHEHIQTLEDGEKLYTSLSVQQMAIFIRAARDTGILTNKNHTAFLKTIAKIFRTPHADSISSESLRVKYYTAEPGAIQSVKDLLLEMFKKVQTYKP